jgi:hypothetical protein
LMQRTGARRQYLVSAWPIRSRALKPSSRGRDTHLAICARAR